jgi:SAM-dependent methyltransferase
MLLSQQTQFVPAISREKMSIQLRCPRCSSSLGDLRQESTTIACSRCKVNIPCEHGVWRALLPEREAHFSRFVEDYQFIRASEGRGSVSDDYYLALPDRDLSGRNSFQWAIRARTFRYIERRLLPRLTDLAKPNLRILDLGAGNGWMSYRLALRGHEPIAVDLMTNDQDGLEAAEHYKKWLPTLFARFQAEHDNLPFACGQFDLVIFNASFHYSENYEKTMAEALRCVRKDGTVLIADTPWYDSEQSGVRMLEERRALFIKRYGFPSDGLSSLEYLTDQRLASLETRFSLRWQVHEPYYGIRWQMRPWLAKLRRKRSPSQFRIYTARAS